MSELAAEGQMTSAVVSAPSGLNALSVDLEDWFHVCGAPAMSDPAGWDRFESRIGKNTERALALLREWSARATFFVLGYVAEREPALVRAVLAEGHEVATHGHFHRRVYDMSPAEFAEDLGRSLEALRAAGAPPVLGYRAPEWSLRRGTLWALAALRRHGLRYDSSMVPWSRMGDADFPQVPCRLETEAGELLEFPLTTAERLGQRLPFTGGLALRLAPLSLVVAELRRLNACGTPALVYLHPWELDPEQPRIRLPWSRTIMHYWNLGASRRKLSELLRCFRFAPLAEVLGLWP